MASSCSVQQIKICSCGQVASLSRSGTSQNPGRLFWDCSNWRTRNCGYFKWATAEEEEIFGCRTISWAVVGGEASNTSGLKRERTVREDVEGKVLLSLKLIVVLPVFFILLGFLLGRL